MQFQQGERARQMKRHVPSPCAESRVDLSKDEHGGRCDGSLMVDTHHDKFSKATECTTPTVNPSVNCEFGVMM